MRMEQGQSVYVNRRFSLIGCYILDVMICGLAVGDAPRRIQRTGNDRPITVDRLSKDAYRITLWLPIDSNHRVESPSLLIQKTATGYLLNGFRTVELMQAGGTLKVTPHQYHLEAITDSHMQQAETFLKRAKDVHSLTLDNGPRTTTH